MAKKNKSYSVYFKIQIETEVEVLAENYEQALAKARDLGVKDVVEFDTPYNDGNIAVVGVYNFAEENHK